MAGENERILKLLSEQFGDISSATTEIINLSAILQLPKGTEHFLSDLHGEYEAFSYLLRSASGVIRLKIEEVFEHLLTTEEKDNLANLVYDPKTELSTLKKQVPLGEDWYRVTLYRLVKLCRVMASKYTRSKVRKALPREFSYIIEELLHEHQHFSDKDSYYRGILETILHTGRANHFLIAIAELIQRLAVDCLHILGDIFDRGPNPHRILDTLIQYHSVDIAWGNHDILWMGACAGNPACVAAVLRISARYNHLETLENGYGIGLRQLVSFGERVYKTHLAQAFYPVGVDFINQREQQSVAALHQAIAVIEWKLSAQIIRRHPEYEMEDRLLLGQIDFSKKEVMIEGKAYPINPDFFPTVNPAHPEELTREEGELMQLLCRLFQNSQKLSAHVNFLFSHGGMYRVMNGNLMYHGCIPMEGNGEFVSFLGQQGKGLLDFSEKMVRKGFFLPQDHPEKEHCRDFFWYLWCGKYSPLFGKGGMKTFERYFLEEKATHHEEKNPYYQLIETAHSEKIAQKILAEFSLTGENAHIINGHVPVRQSRGENPVKAGGRLFMIDGGLSPAYRKQTGIGGYTLIFNSHGFLLTAHEPFSEEKEGQRRRLSSRTVATAPFGDRIRVLDTDAGKELGRRIEELVELVRFYQEGKF